MRILVTGSPGSGKTTLLMKVVEELKRTPSVLTDGFITKEVRGSSGYRIGFDVVALDGTVSPLSRVEGTPGYPRQTGPMVGKYVVNIKEFENATLPILQRMEQALTKGELEKQLFVIDEIGKMELFSRQFVEHMRRILTSPQPMKVICTIAEKGYGFIEEAKRLPGVQLIQVTPGNRNQMVSTIRDLVKEAPTTQVPSTQVSPSVTSASTSSKAPSNSRHGYSAMTHSLRGSGSSCPLAEHSKPTGNSSSVSTGNPSVSSTSATATATATASISTNDCSSTTSAAGTYQRTNVRVITCGKNDKGQVGNGQLEVESVGEPYYPQFVKDNATNSTTLTWKKVAAGFNHCVAVPEGGGGEGGGVVYVWGSGGSGQLGVGNVVSQVLSPQKVVVAIPQQQQQEIIDVACGGEHTLFLTKSGELFGCGSNQNGQLGRPLVPPPSSSSTTPPVSTWLSPTQISTSFVQKPPIRSVSCGYMHSACIDSEGTLYTWGDNGKGQCGHSFPRVRHVFDPQPVQLPSSDQKVVAQSAALGRWHTLVLTELGLVYGFGWGRFGVLGQGDDRDSGGKVLLIKMPIEGMRVNLIASGAVHCGAVAFPNTVVVWGRGSLGRLGLGSFANALTPQLVKGLPSNSNVRSIGMGGDFTMVTLTNSHNQVEVWAWGKGEEGQLGLLSDRKNHQQPVRAFERTVTRLALGDCHWVALVQELPTPSIKSSERSELPHKRAHK